jgi:rRNA maturation endonuclease Nob1
MPSTMTTLLAAHSREPQEHAEPNDHAAVERMIDEGGPVSSFEPRAGSRCATCGGPKSERAVRCARCSSRGQRRVALDEEPSAEERMTERRLSRTHYRLYCYSCGRSAPVDSPPARPGRCASCGGTMLTELDPS